MKNGLIGMIALGGLVVASLGILPSTGTAEERVFDRKSPRDQNDIIYGGRGVSDRSAVAGVCSLIIPGLGQAVNSNEGKKIVVHLVVGLLPLVMYVHPAGGIFFLFHIWSGWDALIDRRGGYINGTVSAPVEWLDATNNGTPDSPAFV